MAQAALLPPDQGQDEARRAQDQRDEGQAVHRPGQHPDGRSTQQQQRQPFEGAGPGRNQRQGRHP
jgi:hypothetical protein